jgi:alkylation response protein AidB-like acyl-CoA dehydrogenase
MTMKVNSDSNYESYRRRVFDFLWREVEPLANEIEVGPFPYDKLFPGFRQHGLFGLLIPGEYGGIGLTTAQYLPFLAEYSKVSGAIRVLLHVHGTSARAVMAFGTKAQKARYLPALAYGTSSMSFAITEPNAGTGMDLATTAVRDGNHWFINGAKHYITNASFADLHLVCCRTAASADRRAFTAIVIETGTPGFTIEPMPELMGANGPPHAILRFENAQVPFENLIGAEGAGLDVFLGELEPSRVFVAASALGTAERALEIALDFAKQRVTFGKPIAERHSIQSELAQMARDVYALKLMLEDVAAKIDCGKSCAVEASVAKLFGAETVMRVTDRAMDVLGGRSYFRDYPYPLERLYREARLNMLEEGTPSIQRLVIARNLLQEAVPLQLGTLGEPYHPEGINPALGNTPPQDLAYAHAARK